MTLALALLDCVKRGDLDAVTALLAGGADPNAIDLLDGRSALEHATSHGHAAIARLLRDHGAEGEQTEPVSQASLPVGAQLCGWSSALMADYVEAGFIRRDRGGEEGWEVRFLCRSKGALKRVVALLDEGGFATAEPFRKFGYHMVSVPGRAAVERFAALWRIECRRRQDSRTEVPDATKEHGR